jgi:hypothetical protein
MISRPNSLLRYALLADAAASGATGLLMAGGAGPLSALLQLPEPLLRWAGFILLPFAAVVLFVGTRRAIPRGAVIGIIIVNALWVVDSFALLATGWVHPNLLGAAFIGAQAIAVGVLALAQVLGLRGTDQLSIAAA